MKKLIILFSISGLLFGGCKKYLDVNQNVNQPTTVTPSVVLSSALAGSANNLATDYLNLNRWMCYWSRSGNYVPDVQTETYAIPNNYTDPEWARIYNTLNSYHYIESVADQQHLPFYKAAAKVMKVFHFSTLVDIYGNVPYSDAFKVATSVQPKYDDAQTIYNNLVAQLDSAVILFDSSKNYYSTAAPTTLTTDDQYDILMGSGGSSSASVASARMDKWVMFANTLKLKLLIHQSQVGAQAGFITTEIALTDSNKRGFIGAGQSAFVNPGYQKSTNKINPFYANFQGVTAATTNVSYFRANTYAINFYNSYGGLDTRIQFFYAPAVGTTYAGNYDGDPAAVSNAGSSAIGTGLLKGASQNELILSDFESLFLQAEATQRGWLTAGPTAQSLYETAITQSFIYLYEDGTNSVPAGLTPSADATALYTSGAVDADWTASPNKMEAIITQKWAALNGINWAEAWTDYRRLGIPNLPISKAPTHVVPQIPVRYLYPQSEYNTNAANTPSLPANAQFTSKIFWNQ
jgi:Starch-binding associating with outer membrane